MYSELFYYYFGGKKPEVLAIVRIVRACYLVSGINRVYRCNASPLFLCSGRYLLFCLTILNVSV